MENGVQQQRVAEAASGAIAAGAALGAIAEAERALRHQGQLGRAERSVRLARSPTAQVGLRARGAGGNRFRERPRGEQLAGKGPAR